MNSTQPDSRQIQTVVPLAEKCRQLEQELADARQRLVEAEGELAQEQAAVNAFRMHCRLTIGDWVESLLDLRTAKQTLLIQLQLLRQEMEMDDPVDFASHGADSSPDPDTDNGTYFDANAIADEFAAMIHDREAEKRIYRELARRFHPDLAANSLEQAYRTSIMAAVNVAYQQHDVQTLRDLAGEADPAIIAEIDNSETAQIRTLRRQLWGCNRRRRKVAQQLKALRQENTAKLWRHAQTLDAKGDKNWWAEVQHSLEREIERLRVDIADLESQIALLEPLKAGEPDEN